MRLNGVLLLVWCPVLVPNTASAPCCTLLPVDVRSRVCKMAFKPHTLWRLRGAGGSLEEDHEDARMEEEGSSGLEPHPDQQTVEQILERLESGENLGTSLHFTHY